MHLQQPRMNFLSIISQHKLVLVVIVFTSIWVWFDIDERLSNPDKYALAEQAQVQLSLLKSPVIFDQDILQIKQAYEQYRPESVEQTSEESNTMSAEQQALQNGTLTSVFSGNNQLELKAIIMDNTQGRKSVKQYALVSVTDTKSKEQKVLSIADKQTSFGFQFNIVNNVSVNLMRVTQPQDSSVSNGSEILLVMYRADSASDK